MEPEALYESSFTDLNELGIGGVFDAGDANIIFALVNDVKSKLQFV